VDYINQFGLQRGARRWGELRANTGATTKFCKVYSFLNYYLSS
jgi:hypothetical protein